MLIMPNRYPAEQRERVELGVVRADAECKARRAVQREHLAVLADVLREVADATRSILDRRKLLDAIKR